MRGGTVDGLFGEGTDVGSGMTSQHLPLARWTLQPRRPTSGRLLDVTASCY
jgi:hypothetical protein